MAMKIHKTTHSTTNKPIVYLSGDTYNNRGVLKDLGFQWYGVKKIWWMYSEKLTDAKLQILSKLGTDYSEITGNQNVATPEQSSDTPPYQPARQPDPMQSTPQEPEKPAHSVKTNKDPSSSSSIYYAAFPINENIYETDVTHNVDGQDYTFHVKVGREQDFKRSKTYPVYKFSIYLGEDQVGSYRLQPKEGRWTKSGPNYNEDDYVNSFIQKIPLMLDQKEKSKLYNAFKDVLQLKQRDPAFAEFLKKWENARFPRDEDRAEAEAFMANLPNIIPIRTITLNEPGYEGEFPIAYEYLSGTLYLKTGIEDPVAPRPETLAYVDTPVFVKTADELNKYIDESIQKNYAKIKEAYLKYLKSFAYSPEEKEQTSEAMKKIVDLIVSDNSDVEFFKRELMSRQFIRPSKKSKQTGPGMMPQGSFKLIVDDAAIRNHTFTRGKSKNDPDYFYTAIAYNLMRIKHRNIGFMPIFLDDAYRAVETVAKRYGYDLTGTTIASYVDKIARLVYTDLFNREYRSWQEQWNDFNNSTWGDGSTGQPARSGGAALNSFVNLAISLGADPALAKANPKSTYRQLALKHHSDINGGDDTVMKQLNVAYEALPIELRASSWYSKYTHGNNDGLV